MSHTQPHMQKPKHASGVDFTDDLLCLRLFGLTDFFFFCLMLQPPWIKQHSNSEVPWLATWKQRGLYGSCYIKQAGIHSHRWRSWGDWRGVMKGGISMDSSSLLITGKPWVLHEATFRKAPPQVYLSKSIGAFNDTVNLWSF